jgi:hypothetical protein
MRRLHAVRHVLAVTGTGGVIVTTDPAYAARYKVSIAGILALHENAIATKTRRSAIAFSYRAVGEIDLCIDSETAHDAVDRIPVHLDQIALT